MGFIEEFHSKLAYLKEQFPQPEYELAVSFFHMCMKGTGFIAYTDTLLEGRGIGFEGYDDCLFPDTEDDPAQHGVKFTRDLTLGDEDSTDYWEIIVPFNAFLDMLRSSAEWHIRNSPTDETLLLHYFHERNLALRLDGSDFPNQDDAETWWRKCDEKRILIRSLCDMAQSDNTWRSEIKAFFTYVPEHLMLEFFRSVTIRRNYETYFGRQLEDLLARNATFFRGVFLDFSFPDEVRFVDVEHTQSEEPKQRSQTAVSMQTFDAMLQAAASAYAERRPQHAIEVSNLMNNRILSH